ncbi:hypothetical protein FHX57_001778 [Paraburkholderia tropica]|uniref:Uncharacterized protein n=1 Tax=Paraburkholderia tropica TaxID=92647 RepID=A0AAQ1JUN3_9BURK|nr:hypothetical protein [Paraburkholderia tropica]MBB6317903.1 hypothetical protein [Paraburkholderia tropica]SEJ82296.1 hypothetical protein SAMN05216550_1094 [Paraburkholderia tropica]
MAGLLQTTACMRNRDGQPNRRLLTGTRERSITSSSGTTWATCRHSYWNASHTWFVGPFIGSFA